MYRVLEMLSARKKMRAGMSRNWGRGAVCNFKQDIQRRPPW